MRPGWVLGALAVAAVAAAAIAWPPGDDAGGANASGSARGSELDRTPGVERPSGTADHTPPDVTQVPSAAASSDAGVRAPTLAEVARSNRLLAEARESGGTRQLQLYEDALDANPINEDALQELGQLRLDNEDYEDAEKLATRCLKLDPGNQRCLSTLEWRYTRTGDFESAEKLYKRCLEETFVKPGCLSFQVGAALRDGDIPRAKELHGRLAALQPKGIDTIVLEASIARQSGDEDGARAAYRRGCDEGNEFACTWLSNHPEE